MPRPRRESAYERRIRRYLAAHPGATRQEARGHRPGEYAERVRRAEARRPGISRAEAGGKAGRAALLARIRSVARQGHDPLVILRQPAWMIPVMSRKGKADRLGPVPKLVIDEYADQTWGFTIRGLTVASLARLIRDEIQAGATLTPAPSLDQQRILSEYAAGRLPGQ